MTTKLRAHKLNFKQEFLQIKNNITPEQKQQLFYGMLLTRATDNMLKKIFMSGEIKYKNKSFQGKGFRSLGQEAIYGAGFLLNRGKNFIKKNNYSGDIVAPLIRDLGVILCFNNNNPEDIINAQAGKSGLPTDGRDLHMGDWSQGIMMPAAPLAISSCSLVGVGLSFKLQKQPRVGVSFIGEGASSLGEWHEAINFAAVQNLPLVFCIQNNQQALSTPINQQSRVQNFADKALGYGIPGYKINGNNIEDICAAFKVAADHARQNKGPILLELITLRMCGHAHHDDMLYLGKESQLNYDLSQPSGGYVNKKLYNLYAKKDPILNYQKYLLKNKILTEDQVIKLKKNILEQVSHAVSKVKSRSWPVFNKSDNNLVYKNNKFAKNNHEKIIYNSGGSTYLQAITKAVKYIFDNINKTIIIGEDVEPPYGNVFKIFGELEKYKNNFINTPISENAIIGACVGMALMGMKPVGEIQFNDFAACAMNQLANNLAKFYFRWGINLPVVIRMPYGGLRRAGPFHSQDTAPWFYRTPGLKIFAPSTPQDAYNLLIQAVLDPDPVLFYEHIKLYREPKIRQEIKIYNYNNNLGARLVCSGSDLLIISYGAFVHKVLECTDILAKKYNINSSLIDLRILAPLDLDFVCEITKSCSKVLLVGEDMKRGSILESLASQISELVFEFLDAPVRVLGSRDIPVPYAPSLEDNYLVSTEEIIQAARELHEY